MLSLGTNKIITNTLLQSINYKALITVGYKDKMVSIEESKNSATQLPNDTLQIIEGSIYTF